MELNEYQTKAMGTCMPSCENFSYMFLNLVGEVGEFAGKVAKGIRHGSMQIGESTTEESNPNTLQCNYLSLDKFSAIDEELQKEAGDILWQLAGLCHVMGWSLEDIARQNLDKLASRQQRGVIDGNGDNR